MSNRRKARSGQAPEVFSEHRRLRRERRTLEAMVRIYCGGHHGSRDELCTDCGALLEYSQVRLQRCRFQERKTTCAKCPEHCYRPEMRKKVRAVMRYAGPRMLHRHPVLALYHFQAGIRKSPGRAGGQDDKP